MDTTACDIRTRIFAAADQLYADAGRQAIPTVDAVRKAARVNMNDASVGMREWRRIERARGLAPGLKLPEVLEQAALAGCAVLWTQAQALAADAFTGARAEWDLERAQAETDARQLAEAFDAQTVELLAAQGARAAREHELDAARAELALAQAELPVLRATAAEVERRAELAQAELGHAHGALADMRAELAAERAEHAAQTGELRRALVAAKAAERGAAAAAQGEIAQLREAMAAQAGQLAALLGKDAVQAKAKAKR